MTCPTRSKMSGKSSWNCRRYMDAPAFVMYIYIYIYIYICTHMYTYIYIYIYCVYVYIYIYTHVYSVYLYIYIYIYTHTWRERERDCCFVVCVYVSFASFMIYGLCAYNLFVFVVLMMIVCLWCCIRVDCLSIHMYEHIYIERDIGLYLSMTA